MTTATKDKKLTDMQKKNMAIDKVNTLLSTLDAFSALLEKETKALRSFDIETVEKLQDEKRQVAKMYQDMVQDLMNHKDALASLDLRARENLVRRRTNFTLLLTDNMKALENMKESAQRLAGKILDVARQTVQEEAQTNYSQKGHMQSYKSSTLSLSLDRSL
jgi:hypothetical protein